MRAILLGIVVFFWGLARAETISFKDLETSRSPAGFSALLKFSAAVNPQAMISYQADYVQVDLKQNGIQSERQVIRVDDREIKSIVVSQFAPDVVRVKMVVKNKDILTAMRGQIRTEASGEGFGILVGSATRADSAATAATEEQEVAALAESLDQAANDSPAPAEELLANEMKTAPAASHAATQAKHESEIPVLENETKVEAKKIDPLTRLTLSIAVILAVAGGLLLIGRQWAKRKSGLRQHHQIKVLTQYPMGPKRSLAIIRVAGESILIGLTEHNITMIKSLALLDEDLPLEVPNQFQSELGRANQKPDATQEGEDFSFGSVRDMVAGQIREMRSL